MAAGNVFLELGIKRLAFHFLRKLEVLPSEAPIHGEWVLGQLKFLVIPKRVVTVFDSSVQFCTLRML